MSPLLLAYMLTLWLPLPGAHAADGEEEIQFEISVDPGTYPTKAFEKKGTKVTALPRRGSPGAIPSRKTREAAFRKVKGLKIDSLDEVDRDRLYVLARTRPLAELRRAFPKIPADQLSSLRKILRK